MLDIDLRLVVYALWAAGSVTVWGVVFCDDLRAYRSFPRNSRARRELVADFGLLLTSVACAVSIAVLLLGQDVPGLRGFTLAVALGAFLGAGIVKVTLARRGDGL